MARFRIFLVCVFFPLSIASGQSGMEEMTRQRMVALSSHIKQTAQAAGATLLQGSMRMNVFGPEATVGFYTLEAGGAQQQRMVVLETQTDTTRGEAAPPINSANLTFKRYPTRQVVVGDVRIGDKGRTLDVARARITEERSANGFHLLATVTIPIVGTTRSATFKISHPVRAEMASIIEAGP
jgi:hypothetical protein